MEEANGTRVVGQSGKAVQSGIGAPAITLRAEADVQTALNAALAAHAARSNGPGVQEAVAVYDPARGMFVANSTTQQELTRVDRPGGWQVFRSQARAAILLQRRISSENRMQWAEVPSGVSLPVSGAIGVGPWSQSELEVPAGSTWPLLRSQDGPGSSGGPLYDLGDSEEVGNDPVKGGGRSRVKRKKIEGTVPKQNEHHEPSVGAEVYFLFDGFTADDGCRLTIVNYFSRKVSALVYKKDPGAGEKPVARYVPAQYNEERQLDLGDNPPAPPETGSLESDIRGTLWKHDQPHITIEAMRGIAIQAAAPFAACSRVCVTAVWFLEAWLVMICDNAKWYRPLARRTAKVTATACFACDTGFSLQNDDVSSPHAGVTPAPPEAAADIPQGDKDAFAEDVLIGGEAWRTQQ